ncbi:MAG: hypothetical protein JZU62_07150 [Sulfuricurvum sp.]|uniref:hypothetical protein n=1 Tax=Sulfuricurvum sp. TaxID=2025608 RepID=UPI0025F03252|nr:hypothetical protein [Sulfuricurvum sp.]MBV5321444.1 hypothetical protein [Sulfuricurvum sp.]
MRSRNGNCPFIFTSLALISTLCTGADNYYIGYRFATKNTQAINETLSISKAMKPCNKFTDSPLLLLKRLPNEKLETLLEREQSAFIEFAASQELRVKSNDTLNKAQIQTLNSLTLPTRCYAVEFNDDSVTITPTK